jgi:pimeloyl-ACP methyl ester carboxylesterase
MREITGDLTQGATYAIRIPDRWNGVLLNNLDFLPHDGLLEKWSSHLFDRGFGLSGTSRIQTDFPLNLEHQLRVLDTVTSTFEAPRMIVQFGGSGGGNVALTMAEDYADRVNGAVALCAASAVVWRYLGADLLFAARALLAPGVDAMVLGRSDEPLTFLGPDDERMVQWNGILASAQESPEGRARVALAVAVTQLPTWGGGFGEPDAPTPPAPTDIDAVQRSMFSSLRTAIVSAAIMADLGTPGSYSNVGIDYASFYSHADPQQRDVVERLYRDAGLGESALRDDLARIDASPRIAQEGRGGPSWERPHTGRPGVPVLHATTMDTTTPPVVTRAYETRVALNGLRDRYRSAYVESASHGSFTVSEIAVLVDTLVARVESGAWPGTAAADLNGRAGAYENDARFIDHVPPVLNRDFYAEAASVG